MMTRYRHQTQLVLGQLALPVQGCGRIWVLLKRFILACVLHDEVAKVFHLEALDATAFLVQMKPILLKPCREVAYRASFL